VLLLADAQTSGGLLFGADAEAAERAVSDLRVSGHEAAVVGTLTEGTRTVRVFDPGLRSGPPLNAPGRARPRATGNVTGTRRASAFSVILAPAATQWLTCGDATSGRRESNPRSQFGSPAEGGA
jgi:hypothetical protein